MIAAPVTAKYRRRYRAPFTEVNVLAIIPISFQKKESFPSSASSDDRSFLTSICGCREMGYDLDRFVGAVDYELPCQINCVAVLQNPIQRRCEHIFCRDCIHTWIKVREICPAHRQRLTATDLGPPERLLRNFLGRLDIRCDFRKLLKFLLIYTLSEVVRINFVIVAHGSYTTFHIYREFNTSLQTNFFCEKNHVSPCVSNYNYGPHYMLNVCIYRLDFGHG